MTDRATVIKHHEQDNKDIIPGDDGFYVFWPDRFTGAFSAANLRAIADRLDELNAPWEKEINDYFEKQSSTT